MGNALVSTLQRIGYPSNLRLAANPPGAAQVSNTFWYDDYPAPSNFIQLLFSCNARQAPTTASGGYFCSRGLDRRVSHALQTQAANRTSAAAQWTKADHDLTNEAPWVPLYTPSNTDTVSKRIGNYQYNPQLYILLDQLWVR